MITTHAFSTVSNGKWIVDSGATCHMCNDREQFVDFKELSNKQEVTLRDGYTLDDTGIGTVRIEHCYLMEAPGSADWTKSYVYQSCPYLLSVSKAAEAGHTTNFSGTGCEIMDKKGKVTAFATKVRSLYYLKWNHYEKLYEGSNEGFKTRVGITEASVVAHRPPIPKHK